MKYIQIDGENLKLEQIEEVAFGKAKVRLSKRAVPEDFTAAENMWRR